jgi:cobalt-precorrin-5B (C1)-methyltransferase
MILVFGGTTEGRKAAEVLEEGGSPFFYSTKTGEQELTLHHGQRTDGAMDGEAMRTFCQEHGIRLIVDAAHPFASQLHQTIANVASELQLPVIRYERIYPPRDPDLTWIDDYTQIPTDIHTLLATTGVQSISKVKWIEALGVKVIYRILNRESSIALAHQQGATDEQLCFYPTDYGTTDHGDGSPDLPLRFYQENRPHDPLPAADAILLKESGESGRFSEKVAAAKAKSMRIIVIKRPECSMFRSAEGRLLPKGRKNGQWSTVDGPHGLRRMVERLLPEFYPLHSGLTTGTCATAAAVAATRQLLYGETPDEVPVILPDGETISVPVGYGDGYAYCIKEAGDDPDVTNGIEIRATIQMRKEEWERRNKQLEMKNDDSSLFTLHSSLEILGGEGVGRFTLPGFDYPPGEAAINKGPREMIRQNIFAVVKNGDDSLRVTISVPNGEDIARRTFNPRLGIEGGISIIGVSGIVKPFSEEAFVDSIRKCMTVAKASGSDRVVINSGGKSERFVKALYPSLPQQAFVEYGNFIGETLKIAHELGIANVTLGVMLGKAVKLAAGHLDTHSRKTTMDKAFISQMLCEAGSDIDISNITLARELWDMLPADKKSRFASVVIGHCAKHCQPLLPDGQLTILLIDDEGNIYQ